MQGKPMGDEYVDRLLNQEESEDLEFKRVGDKLTRKLETIVAMANTRGGVLVLGIEDARKASGRDRVHGIQENPESVDELRRMIAQKITPPLDRPHTAPPSFRELSCTLRDGTEGSVVFVRIEKSSEVHSIVDGGTYVRMQRSNRQISAAEITALALQRGSRSWVAAPVAVPFDLLDTAHWREYSSARRLTRPLLESLRHLGLAVEVESGESRPTRAAVLLFGENPGGLLDSKCAVRLFHYRGDRVEHSPDTNLLRPPKSISGPVVVQIRETLESLLEALSTGVQVGSLGFEVVQKYPVRVLREAITNAVIHRDYGIDADIHVRVFSNRVEVESPGVLPGEVTPSNIEVIGSRPRNRALVDHLREFPNPPNLDAGEGVRMMFLAMRQARLYPPLYVTRPDHPRESVVVTCFNAARPDLWSEVEHYLEAHLDIGNVEIRNLLGTDDPVRASRVLKAWVDLGLLVVTNPAAAKQRRRYRRPGAPRLPDLFSKGVGKQSDESR